VFGPSGAAGPLGWAAVGPASRAAFYGILLCIAIDLTVIVVAGHQLR